MVSWLAENPTIAWLLGFRSTPSGFIPARGITVSGLPDQRHFSRLLHKAPNSCFQFLLFSSIQALLAEFARRDIVVPDTISLDTKHILAWVQENNPKAYVEERFDKTRQPAGDIDSKLGCKRKHNQRKKTESVEAMPTPTKDAQPAKHTKADEYYWGYGSGVVATKIPEWGEFVLAELTQTFDHPDVSYFKPLMEQVERRLRRKPSYGAFDAAFDAFYVYEYFDPQKGYAAVPFVERGGTSKRQFCEDGSPMCAADLPMVLRYTFY
jgi:hypothetical protein